MVVNKSLRLYVAAPWQHKVDAAVFAKQAEQAGWTITKRWWEHREVEGTPGQADSPANRELYGQAVEDIAGVQTADVMVVLQLAKSEGKAVEQGIAVAQRLPRIVVSADGTRSNLFQYMPECLIVETTADALDALARFRTDGWAGKW